MFRAMPLSYDSWMCSICWHDAGVHSRVLFGMIGHGIVYDRPLCCVCCVIVSEVPGWLYHGGGDFANAIDNDQIGTADSVVEFGRDSHDNGNRG